MLARRVEALSKKNLGPNNDYDVMGVETEVVVCRNV